MTVLVKFWVDGWKTDERCLLTLDHAQPRDGQDLLLCHTLNLQSKVVLKAAMQRGQNKKAYEK